MVGASGNPGEAMLSLTCHACSIVPLLHKVPPMAWSPRTFKNHVMCAVLIYLAYGRGQLEFNVAS
jgi:hypothetical protein